MNELLIMGNRVVTAWAIMDYRRVIGSEYDESHTMTYWFNIYGEYEELTLEDLDITINSYLKPYITSVLGQRKMEVLEGMAKREDFSGIWDFLKHELKGDSDFIERPTRKESFIWNNLIFMDKKDAEHQLSEYQHQFTKDAHIVRMRVKEESE